MVSCSPVAAIVLDPLESHGPKPAAEDPGKHCNLAPGERRNRKENTGPSPPVPVLDAPPQHASVVQVEGARFRDKPVDACLKALAMVHSANRTGFLDWFESSTATGQPLDKICDAFCDNIMCRVIVPEYNVEITKVQSASATATAGAAKEAADGGGGEEKREEGFYEKLKVKPVVASFLHERIG